MLRRWLREVKMERMLHRFLDVSTKVVGANEVECIAGTSDRARDGHIVDMMGMDIRAFLKSGTILFQHDPSVPVGIPADGRVDSAGKLRLKITFAPDGDSDEADKVRRLVKSGIVRNLSIAFDPLDFEPLDPKNPRAGQRVTRSELLEVSFVSVPADAGAIVTARTLARAGKVLSGANADILRQAHDAAELCRDIADVLEGAGEGRTTDEEQDRECRRRQFDYLQLSARADDLPQSRAQDFAQLAMNSPSLPPMTRKERMADFQALEGRAIKLSASVDQKQSTSWRHH
jgi:HK97 family phage prohead protease